jgi:hypothetical protein
MIVIRDQQLRLMVLAHLIRELQRHAQDHGPVPEGFTEKQMEELQALSSAELVKLSEMAEPRVAIQIDAGSLEHGLRQVDYLTKRSKQLEYFIVNGATSNMLSEALQDLVGGRHPQAPPVLGYGIISPPSGHAAARRP